PTKLCSSPRRGEPLTGEPDAGDPPVRFGGRGGDEPFLPLSGFFLVAARLYLSAYGAKLSTPLT
ncbi:MAG: hypothetical protein ABSF90_17300, partial [Syntrophobacteraceae bacterium]